MRTLFLDHALLPGGWESAVFVDIDAGVIHAIRTGASPAGAEHVVGIALPGLASLHSHTFQRAMAGLGETRGPSSDSFWSWRQVMYRFVALLTADDIEAIAAFAFMEMLEGGFTAVGEFHYLHHDIDGRPYSNPAEHCTRIAAAAEATGIGLTLLPALYTFGGFGQQPASEGQRRFVNHLDQFQAIVEGARRAVASLQNAVVGIAPHSLRAVDPDSLAALLMAFPDGPVHIHVAEQLREVEDCLAWSQQRPVEWLIGNVGIDPRWCLIHATHMSDAETIAVAKSGSVAGLCPITEANLGDGIFNATGYLAANGHLGVGTDSNVHISAAGELRQLEYSQRLALRARNVFARQEGQSTGAALYRNALAGGTQALARNTGEIAVGRQADFVVLDKNHPDLAHLNSDRWLDAYVFSTDKAAILSVYVAGEELVTQGQHRSRAAILARYKAAMRRVTAGI